MRPKIAWLLVRCAFFILRGGDTMLAVYVAMIHKGVIKLEQVPVQSREKVAAALADVDLDQNGNIA